MHYAVLTLQSAPTAIYCIMLCSLYSLHQIQFIDLCCIPFTACSNCSLLHNRVFPLQLAPTVFYCIMLYSLYRLHQLQFIALCSILFWPAANAFNCIMLYSHTIFNVTLKWIKIYCVLKFSQHVLLKLQFSVLLDCEMWWVCCDVSVELLSEIYSVILKGKTSWKNYLLPYLSRKFDHEFMLVIGTVV